MPSYKGAVLSQPSLISYWRLDEPGGTTAADSKGTHNGTYSNVSQGAGRHADQAILSACARDRALRRVMR